MQHTCKRKKKLFSNINQSKYEYSEWRRNNKQYWKKVFCDLENDLHKQFIEMFNEDTKFQGAVKHQDMHALESDFINKENDMMVQRILKKEAVLSRRRMLSVERYCDSDTEVETNRSKSGRETNIHRELLNKPFRERVTWKSKILPEETDEEKGIVKCSHELTDKIVSKFCEDMEALIGKNESELFTRECVKDLFEVLFDGQIVASLRIIPKQLKYVPYNTEADQLLDLIKNAIKMDVKAEKKLKKSIQVAFLKYLPLNERWIKPSNNTNKLWNSNEFIPQDLVSMKVVWDGITDLRCVKEYCKWLSNNPEYTRASFLKSEGMFDENVFSSTDVKEEYEKSESAKDYWKKIMKDIETEARRDKFWDRDYRKLESILPSIIYKRLVKLYNLEVEAVPYKPNLSSAYVVEEIEELQKSYVTFGTKATPLLQDLQVKSEEISEQVELSGKESVTSFDDMEVNVGDSHSGSDESVPSLTGNPHFEMLKTDKSLRDIITWKSKFKPKTYEVSASAAFDKKVEMMWKKIAVDFFEWYNALGSEECKSDIKSPEDIEALFQVWFDEHASRSLVIDPKVLPCVLEEVAASCKVPHASCPEALKREVEFDLWAERTPKHTKAFGTSLPSKMKHIPPNNNTKQLWRGVKIPQDLRTMSCVWGEIMHLTSTKEFKSYLLKKPNTVVPKCLIKEDDMKLRFRVPSDYMFGGNVERDSQNLSLPKSKMNFSLSNISKILNP